MECAGVRSIRCKIKSRRRRAMIARETYRSRPISTTVCLHNFRRDFVARMERSEMRDRRSRIALSLSSGGASRRPVGSIRATKATSFIAGRSHREALLDPRAELVAHLPIGVEPLRAAALLAGRILCRPVFDIGRDGAGEIERLVMRLGR